MTEEPYRWLEAIQNRREYIEDQLTPGLPVVAISAEPGILLLTARGATPKLFEIYDHLALGTLGHPADIERVRQTAIDAAHLEGFARSPDDVTARRLVSYNLSPALKTAFEQIFAAPLLFRGILVDLAPESAGDMLWSIDYDGSFTMQSGPDLAHGVVVSGPRSIAKDWLAQTPRPEFARGSWKDAALSALRLLVWAKRRGTKDQGVEFSAIPTETAALRESLGGEGIECAVLDRALISQPVRYRIPAPEELGL